MKLLVLPLFAVALVGCGDNPASAATICDNPVEFSNQPDATTFGFIVSVHDNIEVNTEAARLMETYTDLEVYSVFSVCNCFHGNSGATTLENLKCESSVKALHYNNAVSGS